MWKSPTHETASEKHHRKLKFESESSDQPDKSHNNNEEPVVGKESPSKSNPLLRADSTFMTVCQSLTNNLDLILQGGKINKTFGANKNDVTTLRRHSHQVILNIYCGTGFPNLFFMAPLWHYNSKYLAAQQNG